MNQTAVASSPVIFAEDDGPVRRAIVEAFELAGLTPLAFPDARSALAELDANFAGVVVTDIRMDGMDGLELFERIHAVDAQIPVILISGHADVPMAVRALRDGAFDFVTKPLSMEYLISAVYKGLDQRRAVIENRTLSAAAEAASRTNNPLIGDSAPMVYLRNAVAQVAKAELDVLIEGETGTGKEIVALQLHRLSRRRGRPFVAVNCGALTDAASEAELFGQVSDGSGYRRPHQVGRIEAADKGTLFLDEIDSASPAVQMKLLRVLEEREVRSQGSSEMRPVDLRVVAAAKGDLRDAVDRGEFREDLFYRLNVVRLQIPPLRERREDIMPLFAYFVAQITKRLDINDYSMSDQERRQLLEHDWPGNVRELRNFAFSAVLGLPPFSATQTALRPQASLSERVDQFEAVVIREVLQMARGNMSEAIALLNTPRKTLYGKLKRHGIEPSAYRRRGAIKAN